MYTHVSLSSEREEEMMFETRRRNLRFGLSEEGRPFVHTNHTCKIVVNDEGLDSFTITATGVPAMFDRLH